MVTEILKTYLSFPWTYPIFCENPSWCTFFILYTEETHTHAMIVWVPTLTTGLSFWKTNLMLFILWCHEFFSWTILQEAKLNQQNHIHEFFFNNHEDYTAIWNWLKREGKKAECLNIHYECDFENIWVHVDKGQSEKQKMKVFVTGITVIGDTFFRKLLQLRYLVLNLKWKTKIRTVKWVLGRVFLIPNALLSGKGYYFTPEGSKEFLGYDI